jgi:hypothetical protein
MKKILILILLILVSCNNKKTPETAPEEVVQVNSRENVSQESTEKEVPQEHTEKRIVTVPTAVHGYPEISGIWVNKQFDSILQITRSYLETKEIVENDDKFDSNTQGWGHLKWSVFFDSCGIVLWSTNFHEGWKIGDSQLSLKESDKDCLDKDYCLEIFNDT